MRGRGLSEGRGATEEMRRSSGIRAYVAPGHLYLNHGDPHFFLPAILKRRLETWGLVQPAGQTPSGTALDGSHERANIWRPIPRIS